MEVAAKFIGTEMPRFEVFVEYGTIKAFADAIGDPDPIYRDEDAAKARGLPGIIAPPTFAASFRPSERQPWLVPLEEGRILAGEQIFENHKPIMAGMKLNCTFRLANVTEKTGRSGTLEFIEQEMLVHDEADELVVKNTRVVIYRSAGKL